MTRRCFSILFFVIVLFIFFVPLVAHVDAQGLFPGDNPRPGIVPCDGPECQACHVIQLAQESLNFAVYFSVFVATLMLVYAGFKYIGAQGDTGAIKDATSIFGKVIIGVVIILTAWLVIDTIMKEFLKQSYGPWNDIQCISNADRGVNAEPAPVGGPPQSDNNIVAEQPTQQPTNICYSQGEEIVNGTRRQTATTQQTYDTASECAISCTGPGMVCSNPARLQEQDPTIHIDEVLETSPQTGVIDNYSLYQNPQSYATGNGTYNEAGINAAFNATEQWADEINDLASRFGFEGAEGRFRTMMMIESAGNPNAYNTIAQSTGLMQITPDTARSLDPALKFSSDAEIIDRLKDPQYNLTLAGRHFADLYRKYQNPDLVTAAWNGGEKANNPSRDCSAGLAWQCTINGDGYIETRNYINNANQIEKYLQNSN